MNIDQFCTSCRDNCLVFHTRSCIQIISSDEDSEEWIPPAPKSKATSKADVAPAGGAKKPVTKRTTKTNQPNLSKVAEDPKGPGKSAAMGKTETTDEEIRERRGAEEKVTQSDDLDGKIPEGSASETRVKNEVKTLYTLLISHFYRKAL